MVNSLNIGSVSVDENGRVTISNTASSINIQDTVDAIMTARRIPVDRLEARITTNQTKLSALSDLKTILQDFRSTTDILRGVEKFQGAGNVFNTKVALLTASRQDTTTPSDASTIASILPGTNADLGEVNFEVLRTAKAHKIASDGQSSKSTALSETGVIEIEGKAIVIESSDTLLDIASRINSANKGATATGVSASVVSVSSTEHILVLTNQGTGEDIRLVDNDGVLQNLGVLDGSGLVNNELQSAQSARVKLTGVVDVDRFESAKYTSTSTALGLSTGNLTIGGNDVAVTGTTTLADLQTAIDGLTNANGGGNISANIITDENGYRLEIIDDAGNAIAVTSNADIDEELSLDNTQIAERTGSEITTDIDRYTSYYYADDSAALGLTGNIVLDPSGANISVAVGASDTLQDIAANIDAEVGYSAQVITDGDGFRLEITKDDETALELGETGSVVTSLGLDNTTVTKGSGNTIDDLFTGVTISLYKAEEGTNIQATVETDLTQVKQAVTDFVTAYNNLIVFVNQQTAIDPLTGTFTEDAVLNKSPALKDANREISRVLSEAVEGISGAFTGLSQVGIEFVDNSLISDSLYYNTLEIDDDTLDEALLQNIDDVRSLFTFESTVSNPSVEVISFDENTTYNASGFVLNITGHDGTSITGADFDGDLTGANIEISGNVITVIDGDAKGLVLAYTGSTTASNIDVNYTVGAAAKLFNEVERILEPVALNGAGEATSGGSLESEIHFTEGTNEDYQDRIDRMLSRLAIQREALLKRFVAMEAAVSRSNSILSSLEQISAVQTSG